MSDAAAGESTSATRLALVGITKRFGSNVALDNASLVVRRGTVHALLGENGAGKTTLMRVAFGLIEPDGGRIEINGRAIRLTSAGDAIRAGLGMVHQHFTNVPAMTVAENVALGGSGAYDRRRAAERVRQIVERTGLALAPDALAGELPVGAQQRLEIVKALAREATVLILDEPTAVLAPAEASELLRWLRAYANRGNSVVLITHKLHEALAIADDITVLRRGRMVLTARAAQVDAEGLAAALLGDGEALDVAQTTLRDASPGEVAASVADVTVTDERGVPRVTHANLAVHRGEILGIAAVEGAGQHELLRVLAGRITPDTGSVNIPQNVGFVPEDRHRDALVLELSATENVMLKNAGPRRGLLRWRRAAAHTQSLMRDFDVRGGGAGSAVRALSGGNQQKLVVARELDDAPRLFVVENPTRGLDIRATSAVHARLRAIAGAGAAVVVYSSDLDEVLSLATRVVAMHAGTLTETSRDRDAVGRAMLGVAGGAA